jgi:hypothetical protein
MAARYLYLAHSDLLPNVCIVSYHTDSFYLSFALIVASTSVFVSMKPKKKLYFLLNTHQIHIILVPLEALKTSYH